MEIKSAKDNVSQNDLDFERFMKNIGFNQR